MRIYIVRHGATDWNERGIMQGHAETPLNAVGRRQAERAAEALREVGIDRIVTSDLTRARQTAKAIATATNAPMACDVRLRERSFGDWEGISYEEFLQRSYSTAEEDGITCFEVRPPGGESLADVWRRIEPVVREIEAEDGRLALVMHGGSCATLLAQLVRASQPTVRSFRFDNASITELSRRPVEGLYVIVRYNDVAHLRGNAAC
jgi:broad specificity phosphatase PhoE